MRKNIFYFEYYPKTKIDKGFGQITIYDKEGNKEDVINLDIPKNEFTSIFLAFKECSNKECYKE